MSMVQSLSRLRRRRRMADLQIGNQQGVAAVGGKNVNGGAADRTAFTDANHATVTAMRARLTAISATTYTTAMLDRMTQNDMIYALRLADAPTTVK
jgi:hypothetical protein